MKRFGRFIVSFGGLFRGVEISEMDVTPIVLNSAPPNPFSALVVAVNTNETALIIFLLLPILHILSVSTSEKIGAPIVECISIAVLALFWFTTIKDNSMHSYFRPKEFPIKTRCISNCIETLRTFIPVRIPRELREPLKILSVHDGVLPLRERNESVRLIERLGNRMNEAFVVLA